jgi:hypothetical protein
MFSELLKAAVGVVIETPVALAKDVLTLGGACTDQDTPYTYQALEKVSDNISKATE